MNKKFNGNYLYSIALFLSLLIITLPFYTSSAMAVMGGNSEVVKKKAEPIHFLAELDDITGMATTGNNTPTITNAPQACIEKNKKTHALVDALDNGIIKILEEISSFLHAISSIWTAVRGIMLAASIALQSYPPTTAAGETIQKIVNTIDDSSFMQLFNSIIGCEWAKWCKSGLDLPGGMSVSIGPYDNIYVAIGCLCPTAVLLNMRKLKTIYQTYNCCVEQACTNGMSTISCEKQLSEAECMYWGKGAIASFLVKAIIGIIAQLLVKHVITPLISQKPKLAGAIIGLAMIPFQVMNLVQAIKMMGKVFSEPDCSDLGFDKLKDEMKEEWRRANVGTTEVKMVDTNGDGRLNKVET